MDDIEDKLIIYSDVGGKRVGVELRREFLIFSAWTQSADFPSLGALQEPISEYAKMGLNSFIEIELVVDLLFKLYLKYHTKTKRDLELLYSYITLCSAMKSFYKEHLSVDQSFEIFLIKMAYPRLGDGTLLEDLSKFYNALVNHDRTVSYTPSFLMLRGVMLSNYLVECALPFHKFFQMAPPHNARLIENQESWKYIKSIFEACAAQIKPDFTPEQKGEIFSKFFYCTGNDNIQAQLKKHGDWDQREGESDSSARTRIRKAYFKTFNAWMDRRKKRALAFEAKTVKSLEETLWKKGTKEQFLAPMFKQLSQLDLSPEMNKKMLDQVRELLQNLKLE